MCSANNIQMVNLITNTLEVIEKENVYNLEIDVQSEAAFQTEIERKLFYKNHKRHDEEECSSLNHRKVPTIYCAPKYHNILAVHLLSNISSDPDSKYPTVGCQQRFVPAPGSCLVYKPHCAFSSYLSNSISISVISEISIPIDSIVPEFCYLPLSMGHTLTLFISPYNPIAKMPRSQSDPLHAFLQ